MYRVVSVVPLSDFQLRVQFDDGTQGIASLQDRLFGPVFEPLKNLAFFQKVRIDEFGVICWPNGADLAPDALYAQLREPAAAR